MQALTPHQVVEIWERARTGDLPGTAIAILSIALPQSDPEELARLPVGDRDSLLLAIREATFGRLLRIRAECPACEESLEAELTVDDVRREAEPGDRLLSLEHDGYEVRFRLPHTLDLAASLASRGSSPDTPEPAVETLLARCVESAHRDREECSAATLPPRVREMLSAAMARADPQADVAFQLRCPACSESWSAGFDIVSHLSGEVEARTRRLLLEVHALASVYGWTEREVLDLSPARRRAYLELAGT